MHKQNSNKTFQNVTSLLDCKSHEKQPIQEAIKDCKKFYKQPMQETIKDCKNLEKQP